MMNMQEAILLILVNKPTLIAGFSPRPGRFSLMAYESLTRHGHTVYLMNNRGGAFEGRRVFRFCPHELFPGQVHTITLYMRAAHQKQYYDCFLGLRPERMLFNPGTENKELYDLCLAQGIEPVEGCTLVMLNTGQY